MLATIYARFSSAEQAKGTSITRQLELCSAFAKQHGWQVSDTLKEEGKSAYSGANRSKGGLLYKFEQAVERGQYGNGHVLIVEHLDRITRQGWEQVLPFLQKLTSNSDTLLYEEHVSAGLCEAEMPGLMATEHLRGLCSD